MTFGPNYQDTRAALIKEYGTGFEQAVQTFSLSVAEQGVINKWLANLMPEILATQKPVRKSLGIDDIIDPSEPYYGATGGGLSYTFLPTSLGTILTVKESITGKELNVSDAVDWYFYG